MHPVPSRELRSQHQLQGLRTLHGQFGQAGQDSAGGIKAAIFRTDRPVLGLFLVTRRHQLCRLREAAVADDCQPEPDSQLAVAVF